MPTSEDLGRAIRRLRQARHLTIRVVARKAGMSTAHLGVIERGHGNPRLGTLFRVADGLGVSCEELVRTAEVEAER
ncbi:MAG TPA: helix-turn-helix transcriptional regulator [Solirubrobacteraceae bacterium]|jgi:transcriptional regulator with XRE-family HTH domain